MPNNDSNEEYLKRLLQMLRAAEDVGDYDTRNALVLACVGVALACEYEAGIRFDEKEGPEWPVAFIELPTGQVSWHIKAHSKPWDGHTTEEKYARTARFIFA